MTPTKPSRTKRAPAKTALTSSAFEKALQDLRQPSTAFPNVSLRWLLSAIGAVLLGAIVCASQAQTMAPRRTAPIALRSQRRDTFGNAVLGWRKSCSAFSKAEDVKAVLAGARLVRDGLVGVMRSG